MTVKDNIPFNKPFYTGCELKNISTAKNKNMLAGDGFFTKRCHEWLQNKLNVKKALMTHSCTAALEMSALLLDVQPGDEIIMPSYTFVSTANAFVLRGGVPVFVDIRSDTLNIDEEKIEEAITSRTKAIVPVHYAGTSCEMDSILALSKKYGLEVIEDAAQGILSSYKGRQLGSIGAMATLSFHETKNIISGEGGALLINDQAFSERAEIIREKGTDRSRFFKGMVDKYTWQDIGSSYLPGELISAFLSAQLDEAKEIISKRKALWDNYYLLTEVLCNKGLINRPVVPKDCEHNAHIFYVVLDKRINRQNIIDALRVNGVQAISHYVPLHSSPAGKRFGRASDSLSNTNLISQQVLRLPLWIGMSEKQQMFVVQTLSDAIEKELIR